MQNPLINSKENLKAPEAKISPKETSDSAELRQTLSETAGTAVSGVEAANFGAEMNDVMADPEKLRESGDIAGENKGFSFKKAKKPAKSSGQTAAQIKQSLLRNAPSEEKMRREIASEIRNEIWWLQKRSFFISLGIRQGSAFEINNIVRKIRELRSLLSQLASLALEMLKAIWLRFVHGVL